MMRAVDEGMLTTLLAVVLEDSDGVAGTELYKPNYIVIVPPALVPLLAGASGSPVEIFLGVTDYLRGSVCGQGDSYNEAKLLPFKLIVQSIWTWLFDRESIKFFDAATTIVPSLDPLILAKVRANDGSLFRRTVNHQPKSRWILR